MMPATGPTRCLRRPPFHYRSNVPRPPSPLRLCLAVALLLAAPAGPAMATLLDDALNSAGAVGDPHERAMVLSSLAEGQAEVGAWDQANMIAIQIQDSATRDDTFAAIASRAAERGDQARIDWALGLVADGDSRALATAGVAEVLLRAGKRDPALALVRQIADPEQRFGGLGRLARAAVDVDPAQAGALLDEAVALAGALPDPARVQRLRQDGAATAVAIGDPKRFFALVDGLDNPGRQLDVLMDAALKFAAAGLTEASIKASDLASDLLAGPGDPRERALALLTLGTALGQAGAPERARQAFAGAIEGVRILAPELVPEIESQLPVAAARGGLDDDAVEAARAIGEPPRRDLALRGVAAAFVERQHPGLARDLAPEIGEMAVRDAVLDAVAGALAEAGDLDGALAAAGAMVEGQARQSSFGRVAVARARDLTADPNGAFLALELMGDGPEREDVAVEISGIYAERGAVATVERALTEVQSGENREVVQGNLALALLGADELARATSVAQALQDPSLKALVLSRIAVKALR